MDVKHHAQAIDFAKQIHQAGRDEMAQALADMLDGVAAHEPSLYRTGVEAALQTLIERGAADPRTEPRCPEPDCGEPLRLIESGAVGHCGIKCGPSQPSSVSVRQDLGTVEAGSTVIGYRAS